MSKEQDIVEGNKLIAEFMGVPYIHKYGFKDQMGYEYIDDDGGKVWWSENHLKYNWDWSWLMPVVEKISKLGYDFQMSFGKYLSIVSVYDYENEFQICQERHDAKNKQPIETAFETVIQFIQWYQQNQKPQ